MGQVESRGLMLACVFVAEMFNTLAYNTGGGVAGVLGACVTRTSV